MKRLIQEAAIPRVPRLHKLHKSHKKTQVMLFSKVCLHVAMTQYCSTHRVPYCRLTILILNGQNVGGHRVCMAGISLVIPETETLLTHDRDYFIVMRKSYTIISVRGGVATKSGHRGLHQTIRSSNHELKRICDTPTGYECNL